MSWLSLPRGCGLRSVAALASGLAVIVLNALTVRWVVGPSGEQPQLMYGFPLPWAAGSLASSVTFDIAPAVWAADILFHTILLFPIALLLLSLCPEKAKRLIIIGVWLVAPGVTALFLVTRDVWWKLWLNPAPVQAVRVEAGLSAAYDQFFHADE